MKAPLAGLLLLSVLLVACDSADTRPTPPYDIESLALAPELLVGTWDLAWEGSYWGGTEGPAAGPLRTYVIRDDSTFTYLVDGAVEREGTYSIGVLCNEAGVACQTILEFDYYGQDWRGVSDEWLVFDARPRDGGLYAYRRR